MYNTIFVLISGLFLVLKVQFQILQSEETNYKAIPSS